MEAKIYNRTNFHKHTFCVFRELPVSEISNRKPDYKSKSGSTYYFNENGVYRLSNHWSRVANCRWRIEGNLSNTSRTKLGYASWADFHRDNETGKLYFITVDHDNQSVTYQHQGNANGQQVFLRTASETTKIVKQIRNLLETDAWAKYFDGEIETLRREIIGKLATTNLSLAEIRRGL